MSLLYDIAVSFAAQFSEFQPETNGHELHIRPEDWRGFDQCRWCIGIQTDKLKIEIPCFLCKKHQRRVRFFVKST